MLLMFSKMDFSIKFSTKATKFIKKLDNINKERIKEKIYKLSENPFPSESVRVESYKDYKVFRVRVGNFRILYNVDFTEKLIIIVKVDKRPRAY